MNVILAVCAFVVGALHPVQAGANAEFRRHAGHALHGALLNMWTGAVALLLLALVMRVPMPALSAVAGAPWWAYVGGLIGASFVMTALIAAPKLGAALLIALLVAGQLSSAVVVDHFGFIGYPTRPLSATRLAGVAVLFLGVVLIERG